VEERAPGRRLAWSTAIFSLATGLSRILGLVREIVAAYYFSATGKINAFTVAFQVPNLIRALVADAALSSAFVPVFSELLVAGDRRRAWRVASTLFWLMLLGLGGLTALFIVIAPPHAEAAKALVTDYLDSIRAAAPADPQHPVLAPGDRAHKVRAQSEKRGVYLDDGLWADLQKLAAESRKEKVS